MGGKDFMQFPQMRAAFDRAAQEAMDNFSGQGEDCEGCKCVESNVVIETESRVPVEVSYDAGSGHTWRIYGSYKLEMRRVLGTCHPIPKEYILLNPLDDAFYVLMDSREQAQGQEKT